MNPKKLLLSGLIFLLIIPSVFAYECQSQKDCSGYDNSVMGTMGKTICGLYNFMGCIGGPIVFISLISIGALAIVSFFALMYYIMSKR